VIDARGGKQKTVSMRLFIGLSLPDPVRDQLTRIQNGLSGARWVAPESLHLTLRFIGEVDGGAAADIDTALMSIRCESFPLQLSGVGQFGEGRKLRAVWAGVEPQPILSRLQAKVEQAVQRAGLAPERRKFKPHVTLARFKSNGSGPNLGPYISNNALFRSDPIQVEEFVLFSSHLSAGGAVYREEAAYALVQSSAGVSQSDAANPSGQTL